MFSAIAVLLRFLGRGDERRTENRNRCGARAFDCGFDLDAVAAQMSPRKKKAARTLTA
jgi:hypothetical protein